MNYREYEEFKNQITSEKLKENIELYSLGYLKFIMIIRLLKD